VSLLALLIAAPAASAATCVHDGSTVTVEDEPTLAELQVTGGGDLQVFTLSSGTVDCGAGTTSNTDLVVMEAPADADDVAIASAPHIPGGLTDEPGTTDEIEVVTAGYGQPLAQGGAGGEVMTAGRRGDGTLVANLDAAADDEADFEAFDAVVLVLDGGGGADTLTADGSAGTGSADASIDVVGGAGEDTVTGGGSLEGGDDDDELVGLTGSGLDAVASYFFAPAGVEVQLPGGTLPGQDGDGDTDTFTNVRDVLGSPFEDRLVAGDDPAVLLGHDGDDELLGGAGDDVLLGGEDDDTVSGGAGDDTFNSVTGGPDGADVYSGGPGELDRLFYGDQSVVGGQPFHNGRTAPLSVTIGSGADDGEAGEGDDVGADLEDVVGGSGADVLVGNAVDNGLIGLEGADRLDGREGRDTLYGDGGDAEALADAGNVITGGPARDLLIGSEGPDDLRADDGGEDELACGAGVDFGPFDLVDILADDCEHRPGPAAPTPAPTPPVAFPATLEDPSLVRTGRARVVRRRGRWRLVTGRAFVCPSIGSPCSIRISLKVRRPRGKLFLTRKARRIELRPGSRFVITRLLTPRAVRLLLRRGRLWMVLRVSVRVGGGPAGALQARLPVRAPR